MADRLQELAQDDFCYLTTRGRVSGKEHMIEIWFALNSSTIYMLAGGREKADWVRNIAKQPEVTVRIRDSIFQGQGRITLDTEEDALARKLVYGKYSPHEDDLEEWARTSLPVAVDLIE